MNAVQRIVAGLTDGQRLQIISEHRYFEKHGSIGDCLLRDVAKQVSDHFGGQGGMAPVWMEAVAGACYRYYAELFINSMDDLK